ncbi:hypothetical protein [Hyalangium gracile]|uniref:hypothetical protein n=1 Tax=Hyalangium gracile TaxID=394092 RepID=UPI001CCB90D1|nr:hypothetical protein [Hyalangium gracile]
MQTVLIILGVLYLLVGLVVYAATDTTGFAHRMSSRLFFVPLGVINDHVFFFSVLAWPLWLWVCHVDGEGGAAR